MRGRTCSAKSTDDRCTARYATAPGARIGAGNSLPGRWNRVPALHRVMASHSQLHPALMGLARVTSRCRAPRNRHGIPAAWGAGARCHDAIVKARTCTGIVGSARSSVGLLNRCRCLVFQRFAHRRAIRNCPLHAGNPLKQAVPRIGAPAQVRGYTAKQGRASPDWAPPTGWSNFPGNRSRPPWDPAARFPPPPPALPRRGPEARPPYCDFSSRIRTCTHG